MPLTPGARIGPYEVTGALGAGGMGEVYSARDTKLDRDVAIKVLPESFALDSDRVARFTREAKALAALNHPNIAAIYGLESNALVMELVEGEDLSQVITRGPVTLTDALPVARQIADALEAAHEQGIIHRDLKPANVKVRTDGAVKVLDFGLAKAVNPGFEDPGLQAAMNSPTLTARATAMGTILGTAAYMSPEQAKGRPVDKRADIWAFGVVLYEMLAGRRAFAGDDVTETLAAVIRDTPDFSALPAATPRRLRQLVERCLVRDPKLRLRDIGDARIELAAIAAAPEGAVDGISPLAAPASTRRLPWLAAGIVAGLAIGGVAWMVAGGRSTTATEPAAVGRFQMTLPADMQLASNSAGSLSVSPDGRALVFSAEKGAGARNQLWLRTLDSTNVTPLPGTEGGALPFWSPDNAHVAFFAGDKLKRIDLRTSAVTTICDAPSPGGGTWNAQDTIVFSPMLEGPLFRVSAGGGTPSQLTTLDAAELESNHMWPHFLPDGRHYLFQVIGLNNRGIYAGTLDGPARTPVIRQDNFDATAVQYSSSGHIVYVRNHQLVARPFDAGRMTVSGDEMALADGFGIGGPGRPHFSVSRTGVLAFRPEGDRAVYQPTWFSRSGIQQGALGPPGPYGAMELSRDGRTIAFDQSTKQSSTWLLDVARGTTSRFTSDDYSVGPVWFPDGDRLAYVSVRDTPPNPFVKTLAGVETRLARVPKAIFLGSVTPDGATIIGESIAPGTGNDLWLFPTTPNGTPTLFLQTPFDESMPRLSPDGRWVAFTSNEGGTNEIYVTTFPKAGRLHRVSADVGTRAQWSADGKEIIFRSRLRVVAVSFAVSATGEPSIGTPRVLFTLPEGTNVNWVVADRGQRFLFNLRVTERQRAPMTVVLNWPAIVRGM